MSLVPDRPTPPQRGHVVVDGAGELAREVARALRRASPTRVVEGSYAADAAEQVSSALPALVVLVRDRPVSWAECAPWQRAAVAHLGVVHAASAVTVGPLVLPGRTACICCLTRYAGDPALAAASLGCGSADLPRAVTSGTPSDAAEGELAVVAAAVVTLVAADVRRGDRVLGGVSTEVAVDPPTLRHRYWPPHPRCGCRREVSEGHGGTWSATVVPSETMAG